MNSGLLRRRVVYGRNNLDKTIFHPHFYAQSTEFARRTFLQFLVGFTIKISGMRVQSRQHAAYGVFDQFTIINRFDIIVFNFGEDFRKGTDFIQRKGFLRRIALDGLLDLFFLRQRVAGDQ